MGSRSEAFWNNVGGQLVDRSGCPLCDGQQAKVHMDFRQVPILRCGDCGFIFSARIFSEVALRRYYDEFFSRRIRDGQSVVAKVNATAVAELVATHHVKAWLDVGAGCGFLLRELGTRYGISGVGIDLSRTEAAFAKEQLNVEIHATPLEVAPFEKQSFDVVSCFEVIEHVPRPIEFLSLLTSYLKPRGTLILMTDNFGAKLVQRMGERWPKWIPHAHVSHFDQSSILNLINRAQRLKVTKTISYTPWENWVSSICQLLNIQLSSDYDLYSELQREKHGDFPLLRVRSFADSLWFRLTKRYDLNGTLMFVALTRPALGTARDDNGVV